MTERLPDPRPGDALPGDDRPGDARNARDRSASASGGTEAARRRLAAAQEELLASLVAGGAVPSGFDAERLTVQRRALAAKRADVIAAVAPELPAILGADYRTAFLDYAQGRPMRGGYRRDALDFAGHLLALGLPAHPTARRQLTQWWRDRAGPTPPSARPAARLSRLARTLTGLLPRPKEQRPVGDDVVGDGRSGTLDVPEGASRVEYVDRSRSGR
nr:hypothetical protein [Streptomyces niger]